MHLFSLFLVVVVRAHSRRRAEIGGYGGAGGHPCETYKKAIYIAILSERKAGRGEYITYWVEGEVA